jgi:Tol biopolymer transport system component
MTKRFALIIVVLAVAAARLVRAGGQDDAAAVLFEKARKAESVDGDLKTAVALYEKAAQSKDHALAARALVRLAEGYRQLRDARAWSAYRGVVDRFPEQRESVRAAEAALREAGQSAARPADNASRPVVSTIWSGTELAPRRLSADGRFFVSVSKNGELILHEISSDTDRIKLTPADGGRIHDPYLTPDGKRIVYSWDKDETHELRIINLDGTDKRTLVAGGYAWYETAGVTTDGKLASVGLRRADDTWQIGLVPLGGGELRILKNLDWRDTYAGNFSPDGRWVVYSTQVSKDTPDDRAVYIIATDGSVEYPVAPRGVRGDDTPRFTADGSRVVFISGRSDGADLWSARVINGKPTAPEIAKANIGRVTGLGFDQDGTYYFSEDIGPAAVYDLGASGVYVADVDPTTWKARSAPALISDPIRDLTVQALHWSPDGKRLAYLSDHWPVIHDFESGKDRVVLRNVPKEYLTLRGWFPGGLLVGPPPNCRLIDTETQQQRSLPVVSGDCPVVSANGKALFYTSADSAPYANGRRPASDTVRLLRKDIETGAVEELYHVTARAGYVDVIPSPSPDGRSLLFAYAQPDEKAMRQWLLPLSGGEPRELRSEQPLNFLFGTWTQDSRALLFERSNEIWVQPLDGREPYATGLNFSGLSPESVSPDGRRIAFLKRTPTTHTLQAIKNLFPVSTVKR